jgi:ribosomal protein L7/L12
MPTTRPGAVMRLGIDFGTSYSSAAYVRDGHPVAVKPMKGQSPSVPSIVAVGPQGELQVGHGAAHARADRSISEFKQYLGDDEWPLLLADRQLHPAELVTRLLTFLREAAPTPDGPPDAAVLTVPASYGPHRRELMRFAGQAAGFADVSILEEPIAAAHYYASEGALHANDGDLLIVYDLGGGTFDIALVQAARGEYETIGYAGLPDCGGIDFDTCLYEDIKRRCQRSRALLDADAHSGGRDARLAALQVRLAVRQFCRDFKQLLSELDEHDGMVPNVFPPEEYRLTRGEFERMITPLIDETIELSDGLVRDAELGWNQISAVLMVGGSCRIPCIRRRLEQLNPHVLQVDELDLAVAYGAAIYGRQLDEQPQPPAVVHPTQPVTQPPPISEQHPDPTASPLPAAEKQREFFDVILTAASGDKNEIIKVVQATTDMDWFEANTFVNNALAGQTTGLIKARAGKREADKLKADLERAGGVVQLNHRTAATDREQPYHGKPTHGSRSPSQPELGPPELELVPDEQTYREKNSGLLDSLMKGFEHALYASQGQQLKLAMSSSARPLALCRCARRPEFWRSVALMLTSEELIWVWGRGQQVQWDRFGWNDVAAITSDESGVEVETHDGRRVSLNQFNGKGTRVNYYEVVFTATGISAQIRKLREAVLAGSTRTTPPPDAEQHLLARMADHFENVMWAGQRAYLVNALRPGEPVLALCRCARREDPLRQVALVLTSERLIWCRETLQGLAERGEVSWRDVRDIESYTVSGIQGLEISTADQRIGFDVFVWGVRRLGQTVDFSRDTVGRLMRDLASGAK